MVEIEIDEQQREYLEQLRTQLADEHVGDYGHVRYRDALQYLLDHHESTKGEVGAAPATDGDADADRSPEDSNGSPADDENATDGESVADAESAADESAASDESDQVQAADNGTDEGDDADSDGSENADSGGAGSASRLQRMMGLLDDHDDVWEQAESEEGRYAVTLPDGSTEHVRTKDDVRALLFQHYD